MVSHLLNLEVPAYSGTCQMTFSVSKLSVLAESALIVWDDAHVKNALQEISISASSFVAHVGATDNVATMTSSYRCSRERFKCAIKLFEEFKTLTELLSRNVAIVAAFNSERLTAYQLLRLRETSVLQNVSSLATSMSKLAENIRRSIANSPAYARHESIEGSVESWHAVVQADNLVRLLGYILDQLQLLTELGTVEDVEKTANPILLIDGRRRRVYGVSGTTLHYTFCDFVTTLSMLFTCINGNNFD